MNNLRYGLFLQVYTNYKTRVSVCVRVYIGLRMFVVNHNKVIQNVERKT